MKKTHLVLAVLFLVLFSVACGGERKTTQIAAAEPVTVPPTSKEPPAPKVNEATVKSLTATWNELQTIPKFESDWKAELDGTSAESSVLCQAYWYQQNLYHFKRNIAAASEEERKLIGVELAAVEQAEKEGTKAFIRLALENAKAGRTTDCPEAGSWKPFELVREAVGLMKRNDIRPEDVGTSIKEVREVELSALKSAMPFLKDTMFEEGGEGSAYGRDVLLSALDRGYSAEDLGLTQEEVEKMRKMGFEG